MRQGWLSCPQSQCKYEQDHSRNTTCAITPSMKHFAWNPENNVQLKKERCLGLEDVVFHIFVMVPTVFVQIG
jgi:hypothetical protein